jgi:peptidoglycan pentaglycine glycine transferase (the first glycine)
MEFVEIKDQEQWNSFVMQNSQTDILQSWQWGQVKKIEGWTPYRFCITEIPLNPPSSREKFVLAGQVLVKDVKFLGRVGYIPHGPFWNAGCGMRNTELDKALSKFKQELKEWARRQGIFVIEIEPKIDVVDTEKIKLFKKAGFRITNRNIQPKYKLLLDITKSEEEILAGMKKNTRYNIKYAQNHGVEVKIYRPSDFDTTAVIDRFYELVVDMQKRAKGYPARSKKYFERFVDEYKNSDNVLIFEVSHKGEVIAMNISEFTDVWTSSFYAGSNRLFPNLKAPYLLRWASIQEAKKRGCKVYDFWGIIPNSKQHKGYSDNKMSFGGERVDFVGIWVCPVNRLKYHVYEFLLKVWRLYLSLKWK